MFLSNLRKILFWRIYVCMPYTKHEAYNLKRHWENLNYESLILIPDLGPLNPKEQIKSACVLSHSMIMQSFYRLAEVCQLRGEKLSWYDKVLQVLSWTACNGVGAGGQGSLWASTGPSPARLPDVDQGVFQNLIIILIWNLNLKCLAGMIRAYLC